MQTYRVPQSRCRFGIATADMTPPVGIYHRMWGAARHDRATGVHRPLVMTAAVFQELDADSPPAEASEQILLSLEHCILGNAELERIEQAILAESHLNPGQIAIVCSHTHAAGLLSLDRTLLPGGDQIPEYLARVARTAARIIRTARDAAQPATIVYGTGHCALAAHRDYWDENGQHFVCGFNPGEPADDTVLVARVESDDGRPLATVVNYACHPTTLAWQNTLISPDYPGALRTMIAEATGAPCLFLQGASGELGPREGYVGDPEVADRNGRQLGYAVLSVLEGLPRGGTQYEYVGPVDSGATIGVWQERPLSASERQCEQEWTVNREAVEVPYREDLRPISAIEAELAECETNAARLQADETSQPTAGPLRARSERLRRELTRRRALPQGPTFPWRTDLWRIGDAVWLCVQGEPYSLLQRALRAEFPSTPIVVASIGYSWSVAYLPPRGSYGKGLYQESVAVAAPGSLEHTIDVLIERVQTLLNEV